MKAARAGLALLAGLLAPGCLHDQAVADAGAASDQTAPAADMAVRDLAIQPDLALPVDGGPPDLVTPLTVWPNGVSFANSDPWIAAHHDSLTEMRPNFLVINFANGIGTGGGDNVNGGPVTTAMVQALARKFLTQLKDASRYQPALHPNAPPFLNPTLVKVVDLQDQNGHANSNAFPRGQLDANTGYYTVGYDKLFSKADAPFWGYAENGRALRLDELVDRGIVNDVIMVANQVDGRAGNPPDQVTNHILEVALVAQAYAGFQAIAGEYVKNGTDYNRQKIPVAQATVQDANTMPWNGRSLRIFFMNVGRGAGCMLHSFGHAWEFLYNQSQIYSPGMPYDGASPNPWLQDYFRTFADFDMKSRYGAPFNSLYEGGDNYTYGNCDGQNICGKLNYPMTANWPGGSIQVYQPTCGNVHYPPGAAHGYDYAPAQGVTSSCEVFRKPAGTGLPLDKSKWAYLTNDPTIDADCGGDFLVYWFQNMPGFQNEASDRAGAPMKNWWPFLYY